MKIWDEVEKAYAEKQGRHRPRHRAHQGRPRGGHRRPRVPPGQPDRRSPGPQPRRAEGAGAPDARHQGQQEARQHRPLAQGAPRRGERREEEARRSRRWPRARCCAASSRTSPTTARSSTSAASTACCTSPTCRGAASATRRSCFKVNDEIDVIVLKYDPATERVSLGHKQLVADPWTTVARSLPGRRAHERQGRQPHRLRRLHRARAGRRRPDPRQRDVVEQARQAPVEDPQRRRHGRGDGARRRSGGAPHLARPQAGREQPVARAGREVPGRHAHQGQGPQPHRVRRVRRSRGGHRRPDPHLRHVVEQARQAPVAKS